MPIKRYNYDPELKGHVTHDEGQFVKYGDYAREINRFIKALVTQQKRLNAIKRLAVELAEKGTGSKWDW